MIEKLKFCISRYLANKTDIFFYNKGRVALYAILKAIGTGQGDEVILQAFTCVVVANSIKYLGATPVYVDIRPDSYNMDVEKLKKAITPRTRVIICQNTFGLSTDLEAILEIAKERNIFTVEDCTHGFGGTYHGKPNGLFCDASFFSMQWNKPFSSGIGGFLLVNNLLLAPRIKAMEKEKLKPKFTSGITFKALFFARRYLLTDRNYWHLLRLYRWLSKNNLVIGSSRGEELEGVVMPPRYFMDYGNQQAKEGLRNIGNLEKIINLRKANAKMYSQFLEKNSKTFVHAEFVGDHSFLKYPLIVNNRELFTQRAEEASIRLGDWFISPLHPVIKDLSEWNFDESLFPVASRIARHIINLPTEIPDNRKVISFLEQNLELID